MLHHRALIEVAEKERLRRKNIYWQKAVDYLAISAEMSNIGIVLLIAGIWVPAIALFTATGPVAALILVTDPLIYFFRMMIRFTRIIGREVFDIKFEEEQRGTHPLQSVGDICALTCFGFAITFFFGIIVPLPVGLTLAWTMGLFGLCFINFFDHYWPEKKAEEDFLKLLDSEPGNEIKTLDAYEDYVHEKRSRYMFTALIIGLTMLLVCGSAVAFAPPFIAPILDISSQTASVFLSGLVFARFYNWCSKFLKKKEEIPEPILLLDHPGAHESGTGHRRRLSMQPKPLGTTAQVIISPVKDLITPKLKEYKTLELLQDPPPSQSDDLDSILPLQNLNEIKEEHVPTVLPDVTPQVFVLN